MRKEKVCGKWFTDLKSSTGLELSQLMNPILILPLIASEVEDKTIEFIILKIDIIQVS
jgi:hypothetical protein